MHWLIPRSRLHVYQGGHLELAAGAGRLAAAVEAFLDADLTAEGSQQ
jgi:hypothetical protein